MSGATSGGPFPRIAFIAGTLGLGGAERQLFEQCRILVDAGTPPVVLSLTAGEPWEARIVELGIEVVRVGDRGSRSARAGAIVAQLRSRPVDVIQAVQSMTNLYAATAGRVLRRPSIGALRTSPETIISQFGRLGLPSLKWPTVLAGNSTVQLEAAVSLGVASDRTRFLPNLIDIDRLAALERSTSPSIDVLYVGRLGPEKRVDVLLEALAVVHRGGRDLRATLVGTGPLELDLWAQAERLGIAHLVTFVGAQDEPARYYADAGVVVLTSDREGTPNVVLEAMAMRVPVVTTPVGDLPEILGRAAKQRLVPVGDAAALAAALTASLDDPAAAASDADDAFTALRERNGRDAVERAMHELYAPFRAQEVPPCVA